MKDNDSAIAPGSEPLLDVAALRADTPGCENVIHFNNAGCGLLARPVLTAMRQHLDLEASIGGYEACDARAAEVADFYAATGELIGCRPENIAFASSATDAYTRALSSIQFEAGDVILTTRNDFVSNQIAFLSLRKRFGVEVVHAPDLPDGAGVDVAAMTAIMRARRPKLVAATHVPTNSGLVQPVARIGRACRELDLLYLVDACQSVGQYPIDVEEIGCDFLTATARKFLRGPRGTGFLYASDRVLKAGYEPLYIDMWGARWTGPDSYLPVESAARFEDWEFPYAAVIASGVAIRYALRVGLDAIAGRTPLLGAKLRERLAAVDRVTVLDRGPDPAALVTFHAAGAQPRELKAALDRRRINSALSLREFAQFDFGDKQVEWAIRLSPHYYNTQEEVDFVADAVATSI